MIHLRVCVCLSSHTFTFIIVQRETERNTRGPRKKERYLDVPLGLVVIQGQWATFVLDRSRSMDIEFTEHVMIFVEGGKPLCVRRHKYRVGKRTRCFCP